MKKWTLVAAVALLVVALAVAGGWWLLTPHQDRDVAMPADDASPEEVVRVYLDALDAGDCDTELALHESGTSKDSRWCEDVASLTDPTVKDATPEEPTSSGRPESDEVVRVPVEFDLDMRPFRTTGLEDGPMPWGYLLSRSGDDAPWRIVGQGMG